MTIEYRWAEGSIRSAAELAAELVRRQVAVIVATAPACGTCGQGGNHDDSDRLRVTAIRSGWVSLQASPGRRQCHRYHFPERGVLAKRLEFCVSWSPEPRLGVLVNPTDPIRRDLTRDVQAAARAGLHSMSSMPARATTSMRPSRHRARPTRRRSWSAPIPSSSRRVQLATLAARHAIPAIYRSREFAAAGGLMSYGSNLRRVSPGRRLYRPNSQGREAGRPAGRAVHQIRARHQPQAAKALGLTFPPLLALADEVIE